MHYGTVPGSSLPVEQHGIQNPNWVPIFNTDIKFMNVVLAEADESHYPAYKVAKMIDFGLALSCDEIKAEDKKTHHQGTPRICPPVSLVEFGNWPFY